MLHAGSCLCGKVTYEIDGPLDDVVNCHCSMCRKLHAAAFRTRATVRTQDFRLVRGVESLRRYESSPGEYKVFCKNCGSSLYTAFDAKPDELGFPLGTLDTDSGVTPQRHVYVNSKAPWYKITDDLPQYGESD